MGTNSKTLSLLHVAEVVAEVPYVDTFCYEYLGWRPEAMVEQDDGTVVYVPIEETPGCSEGFGKFDEPIVEAGITYTGKIYQSKVTLFKAQDALEVAVEKLKHDPLWLLCPEGQCQACDFRHESVK